MTVDDWEFQLGVRHSPGGIQGAKPKRPLKFFILQYSTQKWEKSNLYVLDHLSLTVTDIALFPHNRNINWNSETSVGVFGEKPLHLLFCGTD